MQDVLIKPSSDDAELNEIIKQNAANQNSATVLKIDLSEAESVTDQSLQNIKKVLTQYRNVKDFQLNLSNKPGFSVKALKDLFQGIKSFFANLNSLELFLADNFENDTFLDAANALQNNKLKSANLMLFDSDLRNDGFNQLIQAFNNLDKLCIRVQGGNIDERVVPVIQKVLLDQNKNLKIIDFEFIFEKAKLEIKQVIGAVYYLQNIQEVNIQSNELQFMIQNGEIHVKQLGDIYDLDGNQTAYFDNDFAQFTATTLWKDSKKLKDVFIYSKAEIESNLSEESLKFLSQGISYIQQLRNLQIALYAPDIKESFFKNLSTDLKNTNGLTSLSLEFPNADQISGQTIASILPILSQSLENLDINFNGSSNISSKDLLQLKQAIAKLNKLAKLQVNIAKAPVMDDVLVGLLSSKSIKEFLLNSEMTSISCLSNNVEIISETPSVANIINNHKQAMQIIQKDEIKDLAIRYNKSTDAKPVMDGLCDIISLFSNLQNVRVEFQDNEQMNAQAIEKLFETLKKPNKLQKVVIKFMNNPNFGDKALSLASQVVQNCSSLEDFILQMGRGEGLTDKGFDSFIQQLKQSKRNLNYLEVSAYGSNITYNGLQKVIGLNEQVATFVFGFQWRQIKISTINSMCEIKEQEASTDDVCLFYKQLLSSIQDMTMILLELRSNKPEDNKVTDQGMNHLADIFKPDGLMQGCLFDLEYNNIITESGLSSLLDRLRGLSSIGTITINLCDNGWITSDFAQNAVDNMGDKGTAITIKEGEFKNDSHREYYQSPEAFYYE